MSEWNNEKLKAWIKEGRGQGEGKNYIPWTKTNEFSSKGRASRIFGLKTQRIHHFHSDNQLRAFYIFEWDDSIVDIRESYPLLDLMEVIDKKNDLRLDKFTDKQSGEPRILTTTFLLTRKDKTGEEHNIARTVKHTSELSRKITFEKLEIERRYWLAKSINWKIITEKQLPKLFCKNLEWVREVLLEQGENTQQIRQLSKELWGSLLNKRAYPLRVVLSEFDRDKGLPGGTALYVFRYLLATKELRVNMHTNINVSFMVDDLLLG